MCVSPTPWQLQAVFLFYTKLCKRLKWHQKRKTEAIQFFPLLFRAGLCTHKTGGIKIAWDRGWHPVRRLKYQKLTLEMIWHWVICIQTLLTESMKHRALTLCLSPPSVGEILMKEETLVFHWRERSATRLLVIPCVCKSCRPCFRHQC